MKVSANAIPNHFKCLFRCWVVKTIVYCVLHLPIDAVNHAFWRCLKWKSYHNGGLFTFCSIDHHTSTLPLLDATKMHGYVNKNLQLSVAKKFIYFISFKAPILPNLAFQYSACSTSYRWWIIPVRARPSHPEQPGVQPRAPRHWNLNRNLLSSFKIY